MSTLPEPGIIPPLTQLPDGTLKQVNPFSGTEVWTTVGVDRVSRRRPDPEKIPLDEAERFHACHFCYPEKMEATPEKARLVVDEQEGYRILSGLKLSEQGATTPEFRRLSNLFEILPYSYWAVNYGYQMNPKAAQAMSNYLSEEKGRKHVASMLKRRLKGEGVSSKEISEKFSPENTDLTVRTLAPAFFSGGHDVIVASQHFQDNATDTTQLASSGTMSYEQHRRFINFTVNTMIDLYRGNTRAKYVVVFQNWLQAAGASTNHVHKELVSIDEPGSHIEKELEQVKAFPDMYNTWAINYAIDHNLIIAQNQHAIMFAGFGHHYPTLEIYSTSPYSEPWQMPQEHRDAVSDMLHAAHTITGPHTPINEEWYYRPLHSNAQMPWRIMLKIRDSTMEGFESGTKIYLNMISPQQLREQSIAELEKNKSHIAPNILIGDDAHVEYDALNYTKLQPQKIRPHDDFTAGLA